MSIEKKEYAIAGIRAHVYSNAADPTSQLKSLPVAILFLLHGRGRNHTRMDEVVNRLLNVQEAQSDQQMRELILVTFVGSLCQYFTQISSH